MFAEVTKHYEWILSKTSDAEYCQNPLWLKHTANVNAETSVANFKKMHLFEIILICKIYI